MSIQPKNKALLYLHIAVFLWGFTAILGKLISYGSLNLVWHRMCITAVIYFMMPIVWKNVLKLSFQTILKFLGIGLVVCAHWITFYGSIKWGDSVSITLACLGSTSFFASIIEPWVLKQAFKIKDTIVGLIVIVGVLFISLSLPKNQSSHISYPWAIGTGLISAALAATFTTLNKKYIMSADPMAISGLEMLSGAIALSLIVPFAVDHLTLWPNFNPQAFNPLTLNNGALDLMWVLLLSVACTNLTFYLGTYALKYVSAFTANLTVNLEPIYGIILGIVIFHENQELNTQFYIGTAVIVLAIFINPILDLRKRHER